MMPTQIIKGVTRQESLVLTDSSSSRMSYLEKIGIITPTRIGLGLKPVVLLSLEQLIIISSFEMWRKALSIPEAKTVSSYLLEYGYSKIQGRHIALIAGNPFLLTDDLADMGQIVLNCVKPSKSVQRIEVKILPPLDDAVNQIKARIEKWSGLDKDSILGRLGLVG